MSDLNEVNSHLTSCSSKIMITEEETANGLLSCILQIRFYSAGCHLQRTGDTMAPSFLSWAKALSTSLRSRPESLAEFLKLEGCLACTGGSGLVTICGLGEDFAHADQARHRPVRDCHLSGYHIISAVSEA